MKRTPVLSLTAAALALVACTPQQPARTVTVLTPPASASAPASSVGSPTAAPTSSRTTSATPTAPSATPTDPWANAYLTPDGYGPIRVGMTGDELIATGYGKRYGSDYGQCPGATLTDDAKAKGIMLLNNGDRVSAVVTRDARVRTKAGAHVGMTVSELKQMYGTDITLGTYGVQAPMPAYFLVSGSHSLVFFLEYDQTKVTEIDAAAVTSGAIPHGSDFC